MIRPKNFNFKKLTMPIKCLRLSSFQKGFIWCYLYCPGILGPQMKWTVGTSGLIHFQMYTRMYTADLIVCRRYNFERLNIHGFGFIFWSTFYEERFICRMFTTETKKNMYIIFGLSFIFKWQKKSSN